MTVAADLSAFYYKKILSLLLRAVKPNKKDTYAYMRISDYE